MREDDALSLQLHLTPGQAKALEKLGLRSVRHLLYHFPARYSDLSVIKKIAELVPGDRCLVYGIVKSVRTGKAFRKNLPLGQAVLEDATGTVKIVWFNQPYLAKMFAAGSAVKVSGKVTEGKSGIYLANPEIEHSDSLPVDSHDSLFRRGAPGEEGETHGSPSLYPIYPETRGITSRFFYHNIGKLIARGALEKLDDPIPEEILAKYKLPGIRNAFRWLHAPKTGKEAEAARKRFAFEEVFMIQLVEQKKRLAYEEHQTFTVRPEETDSP
ncbi:hypothetical protein KW797_03435, partial [Candidatus Parcubacteria bacterium]|nr:hypothetical protein [Candidatus Parcubacteria bacterium]